MLGQGACGRLDDMTDPEGRTAADLAADLIAADRPSAPAADDEPPPVIAAFSPIGLMLYPLLRRHRKVLLPWFLLAIVVLLLIWRFA